METIFLVEYSSNFQVFELFQNNDEALQNGVITDGFVGRLWAYLYVKDLIKKYEITSGEEKTTLYNQAVNIAIENHLVTSVTSLFVAKSQPSTSNTYYNYNGFYPGTASTVDRAWIVIPVTYLLALEVSQFI